METKLMNPMSALRMYASDKRVTHFEFLAIVCFMNIHCQGKVVTVNDVIEATGFTQAEMASCLESLTKKGFMREVRTGVFALSAPT